MRPEGFLASTLSLQYFARRKSSARSSSQWEKRKIEQICLKNTVQSSVMSKRASELGGPKKNPN
jgi:hypothetical protein